MIKISLTRNSVNRMAAMWLWHDSFLMNPPDPKSRLGHGGSHDKGDNAAVAPPEQF